MIESIFRQVRMTGEGHKSEEGSQTRPYHTITYTAG